MGSGSALVVQGNPDQTQTEKGQAFQRGSWPQSFDTAL